MLELLYVADPMCSWCWGFADTIAVVERRLAPDTRLVYVMGGLAPDSDEPMPERVRAYVRAAWDAVERTTGARFNRDFWERCEPRRSTYPACRAVLAARAQDPAADKPMFRAIQRAYYREARNPSDRSTLVELAAEVGLDVRRFQDEVDAPATHAALTAELAAGRELGATGFPSLFTRTDGAVTPIASGWAPRDDVLTKLERVGAFGG